MPEVQVSLYATLRRYVDGAASINIEVEPGCTIRQLIGQLGIPADQIRVVFIDNRAADLDHVLEGGEQIGMFPAIGGG